MYYVKPSTNQNIPFVPFGSLLYDVEIENCLLFKKPLKKKQKKIIKIYRFGFLF